MPVWLKIFFGDLSLMIVRQSQMQENLTTITFFVILQVQLFILRGTVVLYLTMSFISIYADTVCMGQLNFNFPYSKWGVSNGLCEHLRECEQCDYFCEHAGAVINFLMRAASTLEITNGEQGALCKFSASWNLSLLRRCFAPSYVAGTFKTGAKLQSWTE